jgi:peptidyl-prolyl cis-trans isomerase D
MLQKLREKTTGWVAVVIVGMLVVPFAFFGVENYFTPQASNYVAKVNEKEIGQAEFIARFEEFRRQMRQMMGEQFDARQFESAESKRQVLDRLIDEELMRQASEKLGVIVSPTSLQKQIAAIPAFQANGQFDPNQYRTMLQAQGMTPRAFEERLRRDLVMQALPSQLMESGFVTEDYVRRYLALRDQTRSFDYVVLAAPAADAIGEVTDEEIQAYFEANAARYVSEERVSLEYIEVDAAKLDVPVAADEETLRQRYEEQKTRFVEAEQRLASHILVKVDPNADADAQKAAQARAQALVERARADGADFAALARESSEDPGSKNLGGDLGWIEKGITDPAFEAALFALEAGSVSEPVKGADGWHVIQLREVKAETGQPFEEVREELEREYLDGERERIYSDLSGRLVDIIYRDPTTLQTAADELDLEIQRSESFTRAGGPGIASNPEVLRAAFSDAQLVDGTVSDPIDLGGSRTVVVRSVDHVPAAPQPLAEVEDQVRSALVAERVAAKSREVAEAALAKLQAGETLASVAAGLGVEVSKAEAVGRVGATVDPVVSQHAFGLPHPVEGKPSVGMVELPSGGHALIALTAVKEGDPGASDAEMIAALREQLSQAMGGAEAAAYVKALRQAAEIEVVEDRL